MANSEVHVLNFPAAFEPILCTENHSMLQQERRYLCKTLMRQINKDKGLEHALARSQTRLLMVQNCETGQRSVRKLKKSLRGLKYKTIRSHKTSMIVAHRLAAIDTELLRLQQNQHANDFQVGLRHQIRPHLTQFDPECSFTPSDALSRSLQAMTIDP